MKKEIVWVLGATALLLGGCASGTNPFQIDCKKLSQKNRALEPCCSKDYICGGNTEKDPSGTVIARIEGDTAQEMKTTVTPGFVLKVGAQDETSALKEFPKGALFRRIDYRRMDIPNAGQTSCYRSFRDDDNKVLTGFKQFDPPVRRTDPVLFYVHRETGYGYDLDAVTLSTAGFDVTAKWIRDRDGNVILAYNCDQDLDAKLRTIAPGVRSMLYVNEGEHTQSGSVVDIVTWDRDQRLRLMTSEGRYMNSILGVTDYVINTDPNAVTSPVLGFMEVLGDFQMIDLAGGVDPHPTTTSPLSNLEMTQVGGTVTVFARNWAQAHGLHAVFSKGK